MNLLSEFLGSEEYSIKELPLFQELVDNIKCDDLFGYSSPINETKS